MSHGPILFFHCGLTLEALLGILRGDHMARIKPWTATSRTWGGAWVCQQVPNGPGPLRWRTCHMKQDMPKDIHAHKALCVPHGPYVTAHFFPAGALILFLTFWYESSAVCWEYPDSHLHNHVVQVARVGGNHKKEHVERNKCWPFL